MKQKLEEIKEIKNLKIDKDKIEEIYDKLNYDCGLDYRGEPRCKEYFVC